MIHVYYAEDDEDIAGTVREFLGRRGIRVRGGGGYGGPWGILSKPGSGGLESAR